MAYLITALIEFISTVILFFSTILFMLMLYSSFKGIKIPLFWLYFSGAFYLLTIYNAFVVYFVAEPYVLIGQLIKLAANVMILLGIHELYKRFQVTQ